MTTVNQIGAVNQQGAATAAAHVDDGEGVLRDRIDLDDVPEYIVLARPLAELWQNITDCELPSWKLLARSICVLVLAIFRRHFCDYTLFYHGETLYHSLNGRIGFSDGSHGPERHLQFYPHLLVNALYLRPNREGYPRAEGTTFQENQVTRVRLEGNVRQVPDLGAIYPNQEISPQTLSNYFSTFRHISITDKEEGNTIADLLSSRHLREVANPQFFVRRGTDL